MSYLKPCFSHLWAAKIGPKRISEREESLMKNSTIFLGTFEQTWKWLGRQREPLKLRYARYTQVLQVTDTAPTKFIAQSIDDLSLKTKQATFENLPVYTKQLLYKLKKKILWYAAQDFCESKLRFYRLSHYSAKFEFGARSRGWKSTPNFLPHPTKTRS